MTILVLGAGVVGVATAYCLARDGHAVTVVDRQPGPALEASFANGGQISANHATPWAGPATPWKALKWLGRADAPLLLHLRADPALFAWLWRFLGNCTTARMQRNTERALRVALYSRQQLAELRAETGIRYHELSRGILHIFRDRAEHRAALGQVELMNRLGCRRQVVDPDQCLAIEPALATVRPRLIGGIFSPDDESGDAYAFSAGLAERAAARGARFRFGAEVRRLTATDDRVAGIELADGERLAAEAVVVALGSTSPLLLRPLGIRLPVYPAKGYSVTIPVAEGGIAPTVSLIDDEVKMVYSRLGDRLRAAGTAEFIGYDASVEPKRARFLLDKAMELFPQCGDPARAELWAGLRPSTPDGVPVLGRTGFANLFLNTGHGTLGWTMACGAGRIVADLVAGRKPAVALDGLELARFR
ncbi:MAG: D-amino acid dehydrogenase [Rhodospirillales bacterium]|nr:MAG: D-amino acid dehydrogenase [Rhodospirillales bacterium]